MQIYEYTLGSHFASALINDDYTGLDDVEKTKLNDFVSELENHYFYKTKLLKVWDLKDQNSYFAKCQITNLMSNCVTYTLTYI